jgi:hypothetical protein
MLRDCCAQVYAAQVREQERLARRGAHFVGPLLHGRHHSRRELPRVLQGIQALSGADGLRVANMFHAGDGNLHPLILFNTNLPGKLEHAEVVGDKILELCAQFKRDEISLFHALKAVFAHLGLLNPASTSRPCNAAPSAAPCTCTTAIGSRSSKPRSTRSHRTPEHGRIGPCEVSRPPTGCGRT